MRQYTHKEIAFYKDKLVLMRTPGVNPFQDSILEMSWQKHSHPQASLDY